MNSDKTSITTASTVVNPAQRALLNKGVQKKPAPAPAPAYQRPTPMGSRPPQPPPRQKHLAHIRPQKMISSPTDKLFSPATRGVQRLRVHRPLGGPIQPRSLSSVFKAMKE